MSHTVPVARPSCLVARQDTRQAGEIQRYLDRRRPGGNRHGTPRREGDQVLLLSGLYDDSLDRLLAGPEIG